MCSFCILYSPSDFPLPGEEFTALTDLPAPLCWHLPPNRWLSEQVSGAWHMGVRGVVLPSVDFSPFALDPPTPNTLPFSKVTAGNDLLCMGVVVALRETNGCAFPLGGNTWSFECKRAWSVNSEPSSRGEILLILQNL